MHNYDMDDDKTTIKNNFKKTTAGHNTTGMRSRCKYFCCLVITINIVFLWIAAQQLQ